jgi:DNA repair exonuclease SbcCD ATPase subunit
MLKIKNLTVKNFMSVGNATQAINFDRNDLTLVLGENLDLGGDDSGARNGTGKTTIINALSFALYGNALTNIKKDNLINKTNQKNMLVTVDFEKDGQTYKIERGRKPAIIKFWVGDNEQEITDDAQGDSRETQIEIEQMLGMSHDMFKHIVALNTYTEPFLALKANDQRLIIEQLLGITLLSEKADKLKELTKLTKEEKTSEESRIKAVEDANKRVAAQIENARKRHEQWVSKHDEQLNALVHEYEELSKIDIDSELEDHAQLKIYNKNKEKQDIRNNLLLRQKSWEQKQEKDIANLQKMYDDLSHINIDSELENHKMLSEYNKKKTEIDKIKGYVAQNERDQAREDKLLSKLNAEMEALQKHQCHACGQDLHDDDHEQMIADKQKQISEVALNALSADTQWVQNTEALAALGELGEKPQVHYKNESDAIKHSSELESIQQQINLKKSEVDPYLEQLKDHEEVTLGMKPTTIYKTEAEAIKHSSQVTNLLNQIDLIGNEVSPYLEQIADMEQNALQDIDYDSMNALTELLQHQDFLLKLLTNKDSFIRKRIIDQNLSYLNARLEQYLNRIGLPHTVKFNNDLTVSITELGRDLDFDNLSRGERNRLILSLSWSFRDVWESLYQPINLLFIDELVDSGMDSSGVENSLAILKKMSRDANKSIWLVSHKDELAGRVHNILRVVKENGYTQYNPDVEIV